MKSLLIDKKNPSIPPLPENNEYITDFKNKAELFNSFFANQWSWINNNSQLPPTLSYKTNERFYPVKIMDDGLLKMIKFIRPSPKKIFQRHNPKGIKLVTRLKLGLSHLWEPRFKHSFQDTLNPLCSCGLDTETTSHYFHHCPLFHAEKSTLLNNINEVDSTIFKKCASLVSSYMVTNLSRMK